MALTETKPIPLGYSAPAFELLNVVTDQKQTLDQLRGKNATLIMFICNHCPYVIHVMDELIRLTKDYAEHGVKAIGISSNDIVHYPDDAPDKMKELAESKQFPFPYLFDETQSVAKAYHAACTPDFSLFDNEMKCVYRGRLDGSTPGNNIPLTGTDLRNALDNLLAKGEIIEPQHPSMGCNIKWKKYKANMF